MAKGRTIVAGGFLWAVAGFWGDGCLVEKSGGFDCSWISPTGEILDVLLRLIGGAGWSGSADRRPGSKERE
jgi:hypothetical protein